MSASDGDRLASLESAVAALSDSVTTRRLVVVDATGTPRLVAEVRGGTTELRLDVLSPAGDGAVASVVLHAGDDGTDAAGLGVMAGLQLWAAGDTVVELDAWPGDDGRWRPHVHLGGAT
jgi:hypothetical protein